MAYISSVYPLWANLNLLFWLSIVPLTTEWMGENNFTMWPTILYGIVLIMCSIAYYILARVLIKHEGDNSLLAEAIGQDWKGKLSTIIYIIAVMLAWLNPCISFVLYVAVACIWFIPDTRIERKVIHEEEKK